MKLLITGAAGFIGHSLIKKCVKHGHEVLGIDNINDYYDVRLKHARLLDQGFNNIEDRKIHESDIHHNLSFLKMDLNNRDQCCQLFKNHTFDVIIHLAAQAGVRYSLSHPHAYIDSNIGGFINILEGARQLHVKHLVFASSSSVYGLNQAQPFQTSHHTDHPVSLYAATKKSNEMMAHAYSHLYGIPITGLRFFTVYGPWGRPDMAPMLFMDAMLKQKPIKIFNQGQMYRDFTYIDSIIEGCYKVVNNAPTQSTTWLPLDPKPNHSSAPYRIFNIGGQSKVKLMTFIEKLEEVVGRSAIKHYHEMQQGDVVSTEADMTDFNDTFGPLSRVDLSNGIRSLFDWYQSYLKQENQIYAC
ncbi:MAG: NAD-dependent epimerase/dehydratase family protein [Candidatus Comchoanobacterales bacterium]